MKDLLQRLKGANGGQGSGSTQRSLSLAAFGKHPGWDDHIPGIGLDTETLAYVKQTLYVAGIGGQIDSGAWEKLDWDKRLPGFDHLFLWSRPGTTLLGQFWSSTDRKGRAKYPMVICAQGDGLEPAWMLDKLPPGLERLRDACRATPSADAVTNHCQVAQDQLRSLLNLASEPSPTRPSTETFNKFLERTELGPDRVGFLRVLHELAAATTITAGARGGPGIAAVHLRVPVAATSRNEGLLLWLAFLRASVPETVPVLLLSRSGTDWFDVIIGEPSSDNFYCLQASAKAQPFSTAIPYDLAAELPEKLRAIEARLLGQETPSPVAPVPAPRAESRPAAPVAPSAAAETRKRSKAPWFVGGGVAAVLAVCALVFMNTGQRPSGPSETAKGPAQPPPAKQPESQPGAEAAKAQEQAKAAAALAAQREKDYQNATNQAGLALAAGNLAEAAKQAQAAQSLKPNDAVATALLGEANRRAKVAETAAQKEKDYQTALASARSALDIKDYSTAISQLTRALELKPGEPVAGKMLADARTAAKQLEDAAALQQKFQAALNSAQQAMAASNYDVALQQARTALELKPGDPAAAALVTEAQTRLQAAGVAAQKDKDFQTAMTAARSAISAKDYPTAIAQLTRALEVKPGEAVAAQMLADAQAARKQQDDAAALARQFDTALSAARQAMAASNYDLALQQARTALELKPGDAAATALVTEAQNRIQQAGVAAQKQKDFEAAMAAARTAFDNKDFAVAISQLSRALEAKPGDAAATKLLADAQAAKKQQDQAAAEKVTGTTTAIAAVASTATKTAAAEGAKAPWTNNLGMEFVWVPSVPGGVYVGKYEVTQDQYRKVMGSLPPQLPGAEGADLPVSNLSYGNALEFCKKLTEQGSGKYALPTKEEWLIIAELTSVPETSAWQSVSNRLRFETTSYGLTNPRTKPERVGNGGIPDGGVADLLGNVREWVVPETSIGFAYDASRGLTTALALKTAQWLQSRTGFRCVVRDPK